MTQAPPACTPAPEPSEASAGPAAVGDRRRWAILAVLGLSQLIVVLDATVVNIALPSAQQPLGFSDADRQWVITAHSLAFGGLLLLGGRLADLFGRRTMLVGLVGLAVASGIGGAAGSIGMLIAARAAQGVFGAMLAPAALSLLTVTFTDPRERGKAFGIFGAIAGAAIGLLLGGVLTEYLDWTWCLTTTSGAERRDAGAASAMVNTGQQVGGAIGTALLNTLAAAVTADRLAQADGRPSARLVAEAAVAGEARGFLVASGVFVVAAVITLVVLPWSRPRAGNPWPGRGPVVRMVR